ncbi:MAG: thioredoxin [Candidatus Shapirobacteria bacterium]
MSVLNVGEGDFEKEVLAEKGIVVVDFWAPWCGPCQLMAPILEDFSKETEGKVKVVKVNVDEAGEIAQKYNIMSIPAIFIFKDGKVEKQLIGIQPKEGLLEQIALLLREK